MEKKYFIAAGRKPLGPYSLEELNEKALSPDTLIWCEDFAQWTNANEIAGLKTFVIPIPPPTPSHLEYQKTKERLYQSFNEVIHKMKKAAKQTAISFVFLFISIFVVLTLTTKFEEGYIGKEYERGIGYFLNYSAHSFPQEKEFGINPDVLFPLAEPYCYMGIFVDNNEVWIFLIQVSLFWAFMFSIICFIVFYFRGNKKRKKKQKKIVQEEYHHKKIHTGLANTFWIFFALFIFHYLFIFVPYEDKNGTLDFPHLLGGMIPPAIILSIIWAIKRKKEKKMNKKNEDDKNL